MPLAVLDGATLVCDRGTESSQLGVTHATTVQGHGRRVASILDHDTGENIRPFGTCQLVGKPCTPVTPDRWFPGAAQVHLCSLRPPLSSDSFLLCVAHGPAAIQVADPGQGTFYVPRAGLTAAPFGPYYYIYRYYDFLRRHPGKEPPDYYLGYGNKFYDLFSGLNLSGRGEAWIRAVARDLQEAIESALRDHPELELDGPAFRKFAFDTHPEIYRRHGFLELSRLDQLKVLALVGTNTSFGELGELIKQGLGLGWESITHPIDTIGDGLESKFIQTPKAILEESIQVPKTILEKIL